jgi:general stress protein YciG
MKSSRSERENGDEAMTKSEGKQRRGFASMSSEKQREIASKGGRAAHVKGTAHEWTPDEARSAGRKGAQASRDGRGRTAPEQATPDNGQTGMSARTTPESQSGVPGEVTRDLDGENEASGDGFSMGQPGVARSPARDSSRERA